MLGRPPKPSKIRLLEGNRSRRPINTREPEYPEGIQSRPDWLLPEAKKEWTRVCGYLDGVGILAAVDRGVLAAWCQAWARWVEAERFLTEHGMTQTVVSKANGTYEQARPEVAIAQKQFQLMMSAAGKLGLSPADRTRLSTPEPRRDPLEDMLSGTD